MKQVGSSKLQERGHLRLRTKPCAMAPSSAKMTALCRMTVSFNMSSEDNRCSG